MVEHLVSDTVEQDKVSTANILNKLIKGLSNFSQDILKEERILEEQRGNRVDLLDEFRRSYNNH